MFENLLVSVESVEVKAKITPQWSIKKGLTLWLLLTTCTTPCIVLNGFCPNRPPSEKALLSYCLVLWFISSVVLDYRLTQLSSWQIEPQQKEALYPASMKTLSHQKNACVCLNLGAQFRFCTSTWNQLQQAAIGTMQMLHPCHRQFLVLPPPASL